MIVGALIGGITGSTVLACHLITGRHIGIVSRALIGAIFILIVAWLLGMMKHNNGFVDGSTRAWLTMDWLAIVGLLGILPASSIKTAPEKVAED